MEHLPKGKKLTAEQKLKLVLLVVKKNKSVSSVCRRAGISRSFLYQLKRRYFEAGESRQEKLKALESREWARRGRQLTAGQVRAIIKVILRNPDYGVGKILLQIYANNQEKVVSRGAIHSLLIKINLNTKKKRKLFVKWGRKLSRGQIVDLVLLALKRGGVKDKLSASTRLKTIRFVSDGVSIAYICKAFQISRNNFYKWQERYERSLPGKEYQAVTNRKPTIERYWRQTTDKQVEAILKIVIEHPEYSTHQLAEVLRWIGNHGIQNVFRRLDLNTYEKRLVYAQSYRPVITPVVGLLGRVKELIGKIPVISAIPPPLRLATLAQGKLLQWFQRRPLFLFRPFIVSFFSSIIFSTIIMSWLKMLSQAPTPGAKIGLVFASFALLIGSFFFAYSMKYYLTLALVLSFSRQPLEEGNTSTGLSVNGYALSLNARAERGSNHAERDGGIWGWLGRIFGIENGEGLEGKEGGASFPIGRQAGGPASPGASLGGLQPSLDHIELERHPFVSIHLPFYNEKKVAERILKACTSMDYYDSDGNACWEVIVCDDSTDETTAIVRDFAARWNSQFSNRKTKNTSEVSTYSDPGSGTSFDPGSSFSQGGPLTKVLHRETRQGFKGGALGFALKYMDKRTEFVVVFDADFVPYPDTLTQFMKYFQVNAGTLDFTPMESMGSKEGKKTIVSSTSEVNQGSKIAAVGGYQWHVLNKSENWITRGVRTEYAGSYVIERPGQEILGLMKLISGSVYMIRADVLKKIGWGTSITEDFQLTLKLYEQGYKVIYTPYVQAPAECVSTLKRLIRQRMRWAEGHSNNIRRMFTRLMFGKWEPLSNTGTQGGKCLISNYSNYSNQIPNPPPAIGFASGKWRAGNDQIVKNLGQLGIRSIRSILSRSIRNYQDKSKGQERVWVSSPLTWAEKLEFLYLSPYYLQAFFFLLGTLSWLISETVFKARLPFWTSLWGWSLVLTNFFSLPLMNAVGMFLEESEEKDYAGLLSFILLSYILVPFQAYASVKGFLVGEGPWFRTPKTGKITDIFSRGRFYRWISGVLPGWRPSTIAASIKEGLPAVAGEFLISPASPSACRGRANYSNYSKQIPSPKSQLGQLGIRSISNPYLALATANSQFNSFRIPKRRWKGFATTMLVFLLISSLTLFQFLPFVPSGRIPPVLAEGKLGINTEASSSAEASESARHSESRAQSRGEESPPDALQPTHAGDPSSSPQDDGGMAPRITLTDNRMKSEDKDTSEVKSAAPGSPQKRLLRGGRADTSEVSQAPRLTITEINPETHPEKFFLIAKNTKETTFMESMGSGEDKKPTVSAESKTNKSELDENGLGGTEPGLTSPVKYVPYRLTKYPASPDASLGGEDRYEVETRSEQGIQKIVMEINSLKIKLYEKVCKNLHEIDTSEVKSAAPDSPQKRLLRGGRADTSEVESDRLECEGDFELKAISTPIFEYLPITNYSNDNWDEYIPLTPAQLSSEDHQDYTVIKLTFTLLSTDPPSSVPGEIELKIGFGSGTDTGSNEPYDPVSSSRPINKLTFRLGENENVNRIKWKTNLLSDCQIAKLLNSKPEEIENNITIEQCDNITNDVYDLREPADPELEEELSSCLLGVPVTKQEFGNVEIDWSDFATAETPQNHSVRGKQKETEAQANLLRGGPFDSAQAFGSEAQARRGKLPSSDGGEQTINNQTTLFSSLLRQLLSFLRAGTESRVDNDSQSQESQTTGNIEGFQWSNDNIHDLVPFNNRILSIHDTKLSIKPDAVKNILLSLIPVKSGSTKVPRSSNPRFPSISDNLSSWLLFSFQRSLDFLDSTKTILGNLFSKVKEAVVGVATAEVKDTLDGLPRRSVAQAGGRMLSSEVGDDRELKFASTEDFPERIYDSVPGTESIRVEQSTEDNSNTVYFFPDGIKGALEVDPTLTTTVAASTITVQSSDYDNSGSTGFKLIFDNAKGGTIDEFYHDSVGSGSTNIVSGNVTYDALFDIEYGATTLSADATGSLTAVEIDSSRVVIKAVGNVTTNDIVTIDYTIYPTGQIFMKLALEIHDGERNDEGDMFFLIQDYQGYQATYSSVDDTNKAAALLPAVNGFDASLIPYSSTYVGTVDNAASEANDNIMVKYDSAASGYNDETTATSYWHLDLSESAYDSTLLTSKRNEYRNPDALTFTTGSAWSDSDENSAADNFNEEDGVYVMDAATSATYNQASRVQFDIDGGTYTRYKPGFKIRKWRDTKLPTAVTLEGETLFPGETPSQSGNYTGYNASFKPFSEAWYEDGGTSTKIADGGDTADSDEYLADPTNTYTLTDLSALDTLYLGSDDQFTGVNYLLSTQGVDASAAIDWEYWNGAAWTDISGDLAEVKGSDVLTTTNGSFYFTEPSDWAKYTLTASELVSTTGQRSLYWIRGTAGVAYDTAPVIERAWTDILVFQYLGNLTANSQTFTISSEPVRLSEGSIQIGVPNRYRAIMETGDTTDYLLIYDRAQNDGTPLNTYEFIGPYIYETAAEYMLRYHNTRKTTILESSSLRVRIRVEGCFDTAAGGACLTDGTTALAVTEDYTFTTEGMYVSNITDFKTSGVALDIPGANENGYNFLMVDGDIQDNAFAGTLYYGDGATEGSTAVDATFEETNTYAAFPALDASGYQSAIIGIPKAGWLDQAGGTEDWRIDIGYSGTIDRLHAREGNVTPTGLHFAKWYFLLQPENDLDAEGERESFNNDSYNPDILSYTTGSEWDDASGGSSLSAPAPASPGLEFDGSSAYVEVPDDNSLDIASNLTLSAWIYPHSYGEGNNARVIEKASSDGTDGYIMSVRAANTGFNFAVDSFGNGAISSNNGAVPLNKWTHIAVTVANGTGAILYANGQNVGSGTISTSISANNKVLHIGNRSGDNARDFDGIIDEVRIWDDVRTQAEIQESMFKQLDPADDANLKGYWRFNENTGTKAYDETTNNNDGTITLATWRTGYVPDHYNEVEGAYTVDASGSQVQLDIDGGNNASTLASGAVTAGSTTVTVDDASAFLASGTAYIDGDRFTYTSITDGATDTFNGVPSTGEDSVIGHADNSVVAQANRHKPNFKIRNYRQNSKPSSVTMEGAALVEGTNYNVDYKPISDAYFADELTWYSTLEISTAVTSPDVGSAGTVDTATFTTGKYGNGMQVDLSTENPYFPSSSNISGTAGIIEFWFKETGTPAATGAFFACDDGAGSIDMELARGGNDTDIDFTIDDTAEGGGSHVNSWDGISVAIYDGEWHHVRHEYDAGSDTPDLYLDGIQQTRDATSAWVPITPQTNTYIGNVASTDRNIAGVIDEFRVYSPLTGGIDDLADGGDTASANEYLFSEDRDYTLDFEKVDAQNRGEYLHLGTDSMFSGVNVDLDTNGAGGTAGLFNLTFHYEGTAQDEDSFFDGFNFDQDVTVTKVTISAKTAPTGANLTIDLLKGGVEQSVLSTLTAGSSYEQTDITNTNFATTDTFGLKIKQIGSTVAGADLTVVVHYVKQTSGDSANYLAIPYEGTAVDEDTVFEGFYFDAAVTITEVDIAARTAPTGAANLTVDLLKAGAEQSLVATLTAASTFENTNITDTAFGAGDRLGLKIKSIGLTVAGESLTIILHYTHDSGDAGVRYLPFLYFGTVQDEDEIFDGLTLDASVTVKEASLFARTAPVGANLTVDLLKDGSEESRTMTLNDGSTYQETDVTDDSYATTERLGLRIKSVGSTTAGQSVLTVLHTSQGQVGSALNLDWEYWDGDSWADLESISGFTDNTGGFTQDGAVYWTANPTNWRPYSVNGSTDLYYIRTSLNASSEAAYSASPVENFIKTDILILQYLANVTSIDQTLVVVPEYLWPFLVIIPFVPSWLRRKKKGKLRESKGIF